MLKTDNVAMSEPDLDHSWPPHAVLVPVERIIYECRFDHMELAAKDCCALTHFSYTPTRPPEVGGRTVGGRENTRLSSDGGTIREKNVADLRCNNSFCFVSMFSIDFLWNAYFFHVNFFAWASTRIFAFLSFPPPYRAPRTTTWHVTAIHHARS